MIPSIRKLPHNQLTRASSKVLESGMIYIRNHQNVDSESNIQYMPDAKLQEPQTSAYQFFLVGFRANESTLSSDLYYASWIRTAGL